jgi:hypothetical protein
MAGALVESRGVDPFHDCGVVLQGRDLHGERDSIDRPVER